VNWRRISLFLLILSLFFSGCVYFNYLYNAQKYYQEGTGNIEDYLQPDPKNVKRAELQKTIQRCTYILQEYPNSSYIGETILLLGKAFYFNGEYFKANRKFDEYLTYYSTAETEQEALLFQSLSLFYAGQKQLAQEKIIQLSEAVNEKERAKYWYLAGVMHQKQEDYRICSRFFNQIFEQHPHSPYALLAAQKTVQQSFQPVMKPTYKLLGNWILTAKFKKSEKFPLIAPLFAHLLAEKEFALCKKLSAYYDENTDDSWQSQVWAAEIAIEQGKYAEAEALLQEVPTFEDESHNQIEAQKYFLHAKIYGIHHNDFAMADSLLTLAQSNKPVLQLNVKILNLRTIYQQFKEKNTLLAQQDSLQEEQAQTAIDLGQLYYFDLEEPQKAKEYFLQALDLTQDSLRIAQIYYSLGWIIWESGQSRYEAENYFDQSIEAAPNSIYAQKIRQFRGAETTVLDVEKELREAEASREAGDYSRSLDRLEEISEGEYPDSVRLKAHLQMIEVHLQTGAQLEAAKTFKKVLDNFSSSSYFSAAQKRYAFLDSLIVNQNNRAAESDTIQTDSMAIEPKELPMGSFVSSGNARLQEADSEDELQIQVVIDADGKPIRHQYIAGKRQIQPFQLKEIERVLYQAVYQPAEADGKRMISQVIMTYKIVAREDLR